MELNDFDTFEIKVEKMEDNFKQLEMDTETEKVTALISKKGKVTVKRKKTVIPLETFSAASAIKVITAENSSGRRTASSSVKLNPNTPNAVIRRKKSGTTASKK